VLQARELHLELAFGGLRTLREDLEDQLGAVHHAALQLALDVALLRRRQLWLNTTKAAFSSAAARPTSATLPLPAYSLGSGRCAGRGPRGGAARRRSTRRTTSSTLSS
jgi:hypothetical protein